MGEELAVNTAARAPGRWWALSILCLAILMVSLDVTILNVALPTISRVLSAGTDQLQWIIDAYTVAFAAAMLPAGLLGDRIGRKKVLLGGLVLFTFASVACALAVITAATAGGLPLGPIVGGFLLGHYSWRSVFWINVPVGVLAVVAGWFLLAESRSAERRPWDVVGTVTAVGSLLLLTYGLIAGPVHGWADPATVVPLVGSLAALAAFLGWERVTKHRLADPDLFRNPRFTWGTVTAVVVSVALFGVLFIVPQYLQAVAGFDALGTGLRLLPLMLGLLVSGGAAGPLDARFGTKITVVASLVLLAGGLALLAQVSVGSGYTVTAAGLAVCGLGVGGAMAPAMDAVMQTVGGDEAGIGSAVTNTLRQVGGALAVAGLGSVLSAIYSGRITPALVGLPAPVARAATDSVMGAVAVAGQLGPAGGPVAHQAAVSFVAGMSAVMGVCSGIAILGAALVAAFLPSRPGPVPASAPAPLREVRVD
jgi:EmrB/QacA subfamily drug resistance transporter